MRTCPTCGSTKVFPAASNFMCENNHIFSWTAEPAEQQQAPPLPSVAGQIFYGWFDDADQTEPSYDPPRDAPCPFCGKPVVADDVQSPSLLYTGQYAARSYFYRQHKSCAQKFAPLSMDGFILDMIARNGD